MAEIKSSAMFTNGVVSCNTTDLLQQAFQSVVGDENHEDEFVTYLNDENDETESFHLTREQASALRLTFEVDEHGDDVTYHQDQNVTLEDIRRVTEDLENHAKHDVYEQMQFDTDEQWIEETEDNCPIEESLDENSMHVETLDMSQNEYLEERIDQYEDEEMESNVQNIFAENSGTLEETNCLEPTFNQVQEIYTTNNTQEIPQVEQKIPSIIPTPTYIIRPIQTLLKNAKNIRLLSNSNKIEKTINSHTNGKQNSLLIPKNVILNGNHSQIVNGNGSTTRMINGNSLSVQSHTSQMLTTCNVNGSINGTSNGLILSAQNFSNVPISSSNFTKTSIPSVNQRENIGNFQQFITSVPKNNEPMSFVRNQVSNGKNCMPGSFFKSVHIPPQMIRTAGTSAIKTMISSPAKTINTGSQLIFRTEPCLKTQDLKTVVTSSTYRPTNQGISTPISILKPQKVAFTNSNKQNVKTYPNKIVKKVILPQQQTLYSSPLESKINIRNENIKTVKIDDTTTDAIFKKAKLSGVQNSLSAGQGDTTKPLGSSENPIQIVQQGQTFHSMQKLTQSQLKQIAHVVQQRSQESPALNERVVYRLVFPEELDLRMRNPAVNILKGRGGGKRGRPKKTTVRHVPTTTNKSAAMEEEPEDAKEDRKKVVARTRSGRLSRPPRHMVRDYKHLHHLDFTHPDIDDSDGGYSDYNTNGEKIEREDNSKELLTGLEVPKRKISDHFRCPTCNKIYLGRTRMAKHFESHPDHGSPEQLPPKNLNTPPSVELKQNGIPGDPFKRKGKKRGPWAYVTPEAKSERRQTKLKEAISVCDSNEILKIAAKPVVDAITLFDLIAMKSDNNVQSFLDQVKVLIEEIRERASGMLSPIKNDENEINFMELRDDLLCDTLGLLPGVYAINDDAFKKPPPFEAIQILNTEEPPLKLQKIRHDECKENIEERMSSGFSESSDLSVSDFLNERKTEVITTNCPEVLSALTLMPRNPSPIIEGNIKNNAVSKLLISNPEIQSQISDNPGFQKIDIGASKHHPTFRKIDTMKEGFIKLTEGLDISDCSGVFTKLEDSFVDQPKLDTMQQQAFIKLEPMQQGFVKLENGTVNTYSEEATHTFNKLDNGYSNLEEGTHTFAKGFQKLISKILPNDLDDNTKEDGLNETRVADSMPILQDTAPIMATSCDASIFGDTDNLDHITHLDILGNGGVMDEKLVAMHLVDQTHLVDELVSERLENIMPENILENTLMANNGNSPLDTELDFEALSEEFNRNTSS